MIWSARENQFRNMILLLIIAGTAVVLISPVTANTGVTISAQGHQSYYLGEEVILSGYNYDSNFTYLFMTGSGIPADGGKLTMPLQKVVSGDPDSFDKVLTNPDNSWEFYIYTYNLGINPGPYVIYAASQPKSAAQVTGAGNITARVIFKKPFITAEITPSDSIKGQPFAVTGYAEGNPEAVQVWIIGDNYVFNTTVPTSPDQSYRFNSTSEILKNLPKGPCYLIVQHPMQNNKLDIVRNGDWVESLQASSGSSGGTNLFKITGAGSIQGYDAAESLIAAFNDTGVDDTYAEIPLYVEDYSGKKNDATSSGPATLQAQAAMTTSVPQPTRASPFLYTPLGAIVLIGAIFVGRRR
jgi:hypothetical protein